MSGSATFTTVTSRTSISCADASSASATQGDGGRDREPELRAERSMVEVMATPPFRDNLNSRVRVVRPTITHTRLFKKGDCADAFQHCPRCGPEGAAGRCPPQHRGAPGRG